MIESTHAAAAQQLIHREARLLDTQRWEEWINLYCEDAVFWTPAVTMNGAYTADPQSELNFLYITGRAALEARVFRLRGGGSLASNLLPRTRHLVTTMSVDDDGPNKMLAFANFMVAEFSEARGQQSRSGSYEYTLRRENGGLLIAQKKILLLEYVVDGYFDFFTI